MTIHQHTLGPVSVSLADGHDELRSLLLQPRPTLLQSATPRPGGRGAVFDLPHGLVLRHCRRGGALGKLLGDRFASPQPALNEFAVTEDARRNGVAVAEIVAVRAERSGLAWSLDVVTRRIEGAVSVRDLLPRAPVADVARAVRRMHDAGLWHADLNLQNILVAPDGAVRLIDLAGARIRRPLPVSARLDNIARLYRSLVKQRLPHSPVSLARFLLVYFDRDRPAARRAVAAARARMRRHQLWWAVGGGGRR